MPDSSPPSVVLTEGPFNWGLLMISDAGASDLPTSMDGHYSSTLHGVAVAVRHAQDADEDSLSPVLVQVRIAEEPILEPDHSCTLAIDSGTVLIGYAEHEERVELGRGGYLVGIAVDEPGFALKVTLSFSRVE